MSSLVGARQRSGNQRPTGSEPRQRVTTQTGSLAVAARYAAVWQYVPNRAATASKRLPEFFTPSSRSRLGLAPARAPRGVPYNRAMKLSSQEEYGIRCLMHMARLDDGLSLSIPEISKAEGLSIPNVAKLMRLLRLGGLVMSVRGQAGGYTLARPADQISVGAVMEVLGGRFFSTKFCDRHSGVEKVCMHDTDCSIRVLWDAIQTALDGVLRNTTLKDLLCSEQEMARRLESGPLLTRFGDEQRVNGRPTS